MKISIQTYSDIYQKKVEKLVLGIQNDEFGLGLTAQDQPDLPNIAEFYKNGCFWVALDENDQLMGTIGIEPLTGGQASLRKMFLDKSMRGNKDENLAQRLFETLLQYAKEKGCYKMSLSSNLRREKAHQFYESLGFKKHGFSFLMDLT
jgi:GNAT superfamily N-acetyltransferase